MKELFHNIKTFNDEEVILLEKIENSQYCQDQKAYHNTKKKFIMLKFYTRSQTDEIFQKIKMEHELLSRIEDIRKKSENNNITEYYGLFRKNLIDHNSIILQIENGLGSLDYVLKGGKKYNCEELFNFLLNLVEILECLQNNGIVHCDIKPENIILVNDNTSKENFIYKMSDFGKAFQLPIDSYPESKVAQEDLKLLKNTQTNKKFDDEINPFKLDVYSLGLMCLDMIGYTNHKKSLMKNKDFLSENWLGYEKLKPILDQMLKKNPDERVDFIGIKSILENAKKNINTKKPNDELFYIEKFIQQRGNDMNTQINKFYFNHLAKIKNQAISEIINIDQNNSNFINTSLQLNSIKFKEVKEWLENSEFQKLIKDKVNSIIDKSHLIKITYTVLYILCDPNDLNKSESSFELLKTASDEILNYGIRPIVDIMKIQGDFHNNPLNELLSKWWVNYLSVLNDIIKNKQHWNSNKLELEWLNKNDKSILKDSLYCLNYDDNWKILLLQEINKRKDFLSSFDIKNYLGLDIENNQHILKYYKIKIEEEISAIKIVKDEKSIYVKKILFKIKRILEDCLYNKNNLQNETILNGRIDKEMNIGLLDHSIIIGDNGVFYMLMNSMTLEEMNMFFKEDTINKEYYDDLKKDTPKNNRYKLIVGKGSVGKIRLCLALTTSRVPSNMKVGQILCVKKYNSYNDNLILKKRIIRNNCWNEYATREFLHLIDSPKVYEMKIIDYSSIIIKHQKGYVLQELKPFYNGEKLFNRSNGKYYNNFQHQISYFKDLFEKNMSLLNNGLCLTDIKPENTLYDPYAKKAYLIDLAGMVIRSNEKKLKNCKFKHINEINLRFCSPEILKLLKSPDEFVNKKIDLSKSIAYSLGKICEFTGISSSNQKLKKIITKLTTRDPDERISIKKVLNKITKMHEDTQIVSFLMMVCKSILDLQKIIEEFEINKNNENYEILDENSEENLEENSRLITLIKEYNGIFINYGKFQYFSILIKIVKEIIVITLVYFGNSIIHDKVDIVNDEQSAKLTFLNNITKEIKTPKSDEETIELYNTRSDWRFVKRKVDDNNGLENYIKTTLIGNLNLRTNPDILRIFIRMNRKIAIVNKSFKTNINNIKNLEIAKNSESIKQMISNAALIINKKATFEKSKQSFKDGNDIINGVSISNDEKLIAGGSTDKTIKIWDLETKNIQKTLKGHSDWVNSVYFSPDRKMILSGSYDKTIKLWNIQNGELIKTYEGHTKGLNSVKFSHDGNFIISGSLDKSIKIWDKNTGKILKDFRGHKDYVKSACFSHDDAKVVSGSDDHLIKLWNVGTGQILRNFEEHKACVNDVCFSRNDSFILSCSEDATIKLWNTEDGKIIRDIENKDYVDSVCFSPDETIILSGSRDRTIKLWDIFTGEIIQSSEEHKSSVNSVCFSEKGNFIALASEEIQLYLVKWY